MVFAQYTYVFFCLVCCVSADSWDDFTNNLATDLAPLISLFGERVTTQCMSELITTLDDYIFALAPLGILTAVVSLIRVCGNSTLRAFIGRAQEDPGSSELELLSCVSDTTAEVFTESGVARITGNPKILEIVASEGGAVTVDTLSEAVGKSWPADLEKDANLPNLSLNKGIRRRSPFWFYLAAFFGTGLQLGVIIYAALTVFRWPGAFLQNGKRVDGYALPMFVIGTLLLTLGMFFCAVLVERFSKKYPFDLSDDRRVYWIQPGNQEVGDQKFPSFVGQTQKGVRLIRSVRRNSPDETLNARRGMTLVSVVLLTMVGFVVQFVGLRGLHSSVILAQLGATMVMTVVRTCLRAQRMHEGDNLLRDDQDIVCNGENELDWLVFHLFKLRSFKVLPTSSLTTLRPQTQPISIVQESLDIREKLTKLVGSHWNKTPTRKLAHSLGKATQELTKLIGSWSGKEVPHLDIVIPVEIEKEGNQQAIQYHWEKRLLVGPNVDVDFWEAMLGLYVWSLRHANRDLHEASHTKFFRSFSLKGKNGHQSHLMYRAFTNEKTTLDRNQLNFLNGCQTFGHVHVETGNQITDDTSLIAVSSDIYTLAAQDIYMLVLFSALERLSTIGGKTEVIGNDKSDYRVSNDRIEALTTAFSTSGLGDHKEGLICTLQTISARGYLSEITSGLPGVRQKMEELIINGDNNGVLMMSEWLCSLADYDEVEHSVVEYAYFCLYFFINPDIEMKALAADRIAAMMNPGGGSHLSPSISKHLDIASIPSEDWRHEFRTEISWMASHISDFLASNNPDQQTMNSLKVIRAISGTGFSMHEVYSDLEAARLSRTIFFSLWFGSRFIDLEQSPNIVLDWLVQNQYNIILELLMIRLNNDPSLMLNGGHLAAMLAYAAKKGYNRAVFFLLHHAERTEAKFSLIDELASQGDAETLKVLLCHDSDGTVTEIHKSCFLIAAQQGLYSLLEFLLAYGVDVDIQDSGGETALMKAAANGDTNSLKLLLSHHATIDKRDNSGETALIYAVGTGSRAMQNVDLLLSKGADINAAGRYGRTALGEAVRGENMQLLKFLCSNKADIHTIDYRGYSLLDMAFTGGLEGPWVEGCAYLEGLGVKRRSNVQYSDSHW